MYNFVIFFRHLLEDLLELMFWKKNYHAGCRLSSIKSILDKMNDDFQMSAFVDVYKDYIYGDRMQTYALYAHLQMRVMVKKMEVKMKNYKNSQISDARVKKHLHLVLNDASHSTQMSQ